MGASKPFYVDIEWGEESTREEIYHDPKKPNNKPNRYRFATQAELHAFLEGVEQACGWTNHDVIWVEDPVAQAEEEKRGQADKATHTER